MSPARSSHHRSRWACVLVSAVAALVGLGASPLTGSVMDAAATSEETPVVVEDASILVPLDTASAEQALLDLTNADRAQNGLPPLSRDPATLGIARERAASQLTAPSLSHYDATGQLAFVELLDQARVEYRMVGENLARSTGADPGVMQRIEDALMRSPAHRKNILEQAFTHVAIGAATDDHRRITFAEIFRAE